MYTSSPRQGIEPLPADLRRVRSPAAWAVIAIMQPQRGQRHGQIRGNPLGEGNGFELVR
jgi:hypothetical protein